MFFLENNDLLFVAGSIIFIGVGVFTLSKYNIFTTVTNDSLITNPNIADSTGVVTSIMESSNLEYVEASIQTANIPVEASVQAANTYVNTGMQTSARMWLESIRNWITELLGTTSNPQYVDVGVQTNAPSLWDSVKQWFLEVCSVRGSELSSMGYNKVDKWRNNLDSTQSVSLNDSESPLTNIVFGSPNNSTLDQLVDPYDSASQVSEVISESSLQVPSNIPYDINIYNQGFLYESLNNVSNYIDNSYVINGISHTVLVIGEKILTIDPNIVINPFIC